MGKLRLVGSLTLYVSFSEYDLFYRALLQKRPIILRSLLIVATPYLLVHGYEINTWTCNICRIETDTSPSRAAYIFLSWYNWFHYQLCYFKNLLIDFFVGFIPLHWSQIDIGFTVDRLLYLFFKKISWYKFIFRLFLFIGCWIDIGLTVDRSWLIH